MFYLGFILFSIFIIIFYFLLNSENKIVRLIGTIGFCIEMLVLIAWKQEIIVLVNPITIIGISCIALGIFIIGYKKIRNQKIKNQTLKDGNFLEREINIEYTPSIASYIINQNIKYKDLIADIMDLYARKIIDIEVVNNNDKKNYKFKTINNYPVENESSSNKYILKTLINNEDDEKFDFSIWEEYLLNEYKNYGFSKDKKINTKYVIIFEIIIGVIGIIIGGMIDKNYFLGFIVGLIVATFSICIFLGFMDNQKNMDLFMNKKGKNEISKLLKLKEFMKQYTLLKDRNIEQVVIYERYIPYSVALGINIIYRNTKFDIFDKDEIDNIIQENSIASSLEKFGIDI